MVNVKKKNTKKKHSKAYVRQWTIYIILYWWLVGCLFWPGQERTSIPRQLHVNNLPQKVSLAAALLSLCKPSRKRQDLRTFNVVANWLLILTNNAMKGFVHSQSNKQTIVLLRHLQLDLFHAKNNELTWSPHGQQGLPNQLRLESEDKKTIS